MKTLRFKKIILGWLILILAITACEEERINSSSEPVEKLHNILTEWYLWNYQLPDLDPSDFEEPADLLDAARYELDKWSFVTTVEEFEQYFEEGTMIGIGFMYQYDSNGNLRIVYLYEDSPFWEAGVRRGWVIRKINSTTITDGMDIGGLLGANEIGVTNTFEFEKPDGSSVELTVAKKSLSINTVLHKQILDVGSDKVGYLVFESFIENSNAELDEAFQYFRQNNVTQLVLDLRYNTGGMMSVAQHLAGLIISPSIDGKVFAKYIHNPDKQNQNSEYILERNTNSLDLNKLYVISTKNYTASASEALINGLEPYMDVHVIGDDTHGKPVGMYAFYRKTDHYAFVPITFKTVNADNEGDYYSGIPANSYVVDDITVDFGSLEEDCLAEAIYHIQNGTWTSSGMKHMIFRPPFKELDSFEAFKGTR